MRASPRFRSHPHRVQGESCSAIALSSSGEEFDGQLLSNPQPGNQQRLLKDEAYYQAQAHSAFESGQFEEALRHYAKVLEFNPSNVSAWAGQVRMLIELNEFPEAKKWADKALEKFPNEPE